MIENQITVREMIKSDIPLILDYWYSASSAYLTGMGADSAKLPPRKDFESRLKSQLDLDYNQKKAYVMICLFDKKPIGHSNLNKINFAMDAFMHLHLWDAGKRKKGIGTKFLKLAIPFFFENIKLQTLFCEPYALNPAPNKTLPKLGFDFVKRYTTIPGSINFEQEVCQYKMTKDQFELLFKK
jgi:RimJ/RimL family protein N-acetyltransferase